MRLSILFCGPKARVSAHLWVLGCVVALVACGGGKDPILGLSQGTALTPSVNATAPQARQPMVTGVPLQTRLTAEFNKPMRALSLNADSFKLVCSDDVVVQGRVSYNADNRVATFTPAANLPAHSTCVAFLTSAVQDSGGVPLPQAFVWSFETGESTDEQAPQVTGFSPALNAPAPTNTQISVSFDEDMDPETLTPQSLTLQSHEGGGEPIAGSVVYAVGTRTATFTPISHAWLPSATTFTATLSTLATDLAGNPMAANTVWTFTTGDVQDTTAPVLLLASPSQGRTGVCVNPTLLLTFSEAMDPVTLTPSALTMTPSGSPAKVLSWALSYDPLTHTASVTPSAPLSVLTHYTITLRAGAEGAQDLAGNALVAGQVWTFSTGAQQCQAPLDLGASAEFAILGSAAVVNIPSSHIVGNVGLTPDTGANITGFSVPVVCPEVQGQIYTVDNNGPACALVDVMHLSQAKRDAQVAFADANHAARGVPVVLAGPLAGLTLYPGLYASLTTLDLSAGGTLTLDAQGNPEAIFLLRSATAITTLSGSQVVLSGGAQASRVFWTAGSAITLGVHSVMKGSLLASTALTLQTGATLEGRALNQGPAAAAIRCDACTITLPTP